MEKRFLGVREFAEYLGIEESTVYAWVYQKRIPYVKVGRLVKFDLRKIEDWLKQRSVKQINWN